MAVHDLVPGYFTFTLFQRLPKELRKRIWKLAAFEPRLLNIRSFPTRFVPIQYLYTSIPPPAVLHTSQESRFETTQFYSRAFSSDATQRYIWINFDVDTIQTEDYNLSNVDQEERARIRCLRIETIQFDFSDWYHHPSDLQMMKELRDLVIYVPSISHWDYVIGAIRTDFRAWFGELRHMGWKCPNVRIVEKETDIELNIQTFESRGSSVRGRGRVHYRLRSTGGDLTELSPPPVPSPYPPNYLPPGF